MWINNKKDRKRRKFKNDKRVKGIYKGIYHKKKITQYGGFKTNECDHQYTFVVF